MFFPDDIEPDDASYPYWAEQKAIYERSMQFWLCAGNPWQPIETAPVETSVIVCGEGRAMAIAQHIPGEGWSTSPTDYFPDPKWWCPRPPNPNLLPPPDKAREIKETKRDTRAEHAVRSVRRRG